MGKLTGCSAHQKIKASSSKCSDAHHDLFNSNRVNITDACKDGITVEGPGRATLRRQIRFLPDAIRTQASELSCQ